MWSESFWGADVWGEDTWLALGASEVVLEASGINSSIYAGSLAFDPGAGSFVLGGVADADSTADLTGATYGGADMTEVGSAPGGNIQSFLYRIGGQGDGSKSFVPAGSTIRALAAASFSGVDESDPIRGTPVTGHRSGGATSDISLSVPSAPGDMVVVFFSLRLDTNPPVITGGTLIEWRTQDFVGTGLIVAPGDSVVDILIDGEAFNAGCAIAVSLRGGGGGVPPGGGGEAHGATAGQRGAGIGQLGPTSRMAA